MSESSRINIAAIRLPDEVDLVRGLFTEYIDSLGIDLSFQGVAAELVDFPGKYAPPAGMILIARDSASFPVGCVALRPLTDPGDCEIKRLYVRPQARGQNVGRRLAEEIIAYAGTAKYARIRLDTLPSMHAAKRLYMDLGFRPTAPYYENPIPDVVFLALDLRD